MKKIAWEMLDKITDRLWVSNGWIVRTFHEVNPNESANSSMVFVSDPFHTWLADEEEKPKEKPKYAGSRTCPS